MDAAKQRRYKDCKILAMYEGVEAWNKNVPIRWPQQRIRAAVKRRFRHETMAHALLVIFVTPKSGVPETFGAHFYIDKRLPGVAGIDGADDNIQVTESSYEGALSIAEHAPPRLKHFLQTLLLEN